MNVQTLNVNEKPKTIVVYAIVSKYIYGFNCDPTEIINKVNAKPINSIFKDKKLAYIQCIEENKHHMSNMYLEINRGIPYGEEHCTPCEEKTTHTSYEESCGLSYENLDDEYERIYNEQIEFIKKNYLYESCSDYMEYAVIEKYKI
mgnify:CR=1 FL=1